VAAQALGLPAIVVTDHNTLAGIAWAHARAEEASIRLVVGCRLDLCDSLPVLAYPTDRAGYARLCRLLTLGKGQGWPARLHPRLGRPGQPRRRPYCGAAAGRGRCGAGRRIGPVAAGLRRPLPPRTGPAPAAWGAVRLRRLADLAQAARVPAVVTGDVLYHVPGRRVLQDVVTCIREGCTIDDAGFRRERFANRHLKAPAEMARLFARYPEAVARTVEIAERCRFSLSELRYQYPDEGELPGEAPQAALERLVRESVPLRYPAGLPPDVAAQLRHELRLIADLGYAPYFLTVNSVERRRPPDIVRFARSRGILCQGRGSAANSAVCYVLGITSIDPVRSGLLFERFVSAERQEPPDIDVDFESGRREEVIQWVYGRYGRGRAALCCTVMRFRARHDPRRGQGAGPDRGCHRGSRLAGLGRGRVGGRRGPGSRHRAEPQPREPPPAPGLGAGAGADRLPAPARHPSGRLRADAGPARRAGAGRPGGDGRPPGDRVGQGRHRRAAVDEGRRARPRHARLPAPWLHPDRAAGRACGAAPLEPWTAPPNTASIPKPS